MDPVALVTHWPSDAYSARPKRVAGPTTARKVVTALEWLCVLELDGDLWCRGTLAPKSSPQKPAVLLKGVTSVATGESHGCPVVGASDILCWGGNTHGADRLHE